VLLSFRACGWSRDKGHTRPLPPLKLDCGYSGGDESVMIADWQHRSGGWFI
jgi:hypothetical protein